MTISWGSLGTLWGKPIATTYVRESRYTREFMDNNDYFTVSFYPEEYKDVLGVMGTKRSSKYKVVLENESNNEVFDKVLIDYSYCIVDIYSKASKSKQKNK